MRKYILLSVLISFTQSCQNVDLSNSQTSHTTITATIQQPIEFEFRVDGVLEKNANQFEMIETTETATVPWESLINPTEEYRAYHLCEPPCGIFVEEISSGKILEISLPSLYKYRNFKDLAWSADYILEFKQITSPNIAVRYVIDVKEEVLLDIIHHSSQ